MRKDARLRLVWSNESVAHAMDKPPSLEIEKGDTAEPEFDLNPGVRLAIACLILFIFIGVGMLILCGGLPGVFPKWFGK